MIEHTEGPEIDKSDGRGCIGCAGEKGKTCENCTHRNDIVDEARAALAAAESE